MKLIIENWRNYIEEAYDSYMANRLAGKTATDHQNIW